MIEEPLAKLSGFEVINRFKRAERPAAIKVLVRMIAESLSNEQLANSGRALPTHLRSGFRCHPSES